MAGLDCPMQTKAFNLFWHKAELRLVKQTEPEAPVFAMSRPSFFGGHEEFLLQYPARLEPPSERDVSRHRFTVRHGKKRRSFQAPDAATFDSWYSALEQALEPEKESEQINTPKTTSSNATTATSRASMAGSFGTNSQDGVSTAGRSGTRASSRARVGSLASSCSSQRSHGSQPRAPALRLTLERPCFTRDKNNLKLIRLHRPDWTSAATIAGSDEVEAEADDILDVPDTESDVEEPEEEMDEMSEEDSIDTHQSDSLDDDYEEVAADGDASGEDAFAGDLVAAAMETLAVAVIADTFSNEKERAGIALTKSEVDCIEPEVEAAVEALIAAVVENSYNIETSTVEALSSVSVDAIEPEAKSTDESSVPPAIKDEDDTTLEPPNAVAAVASTPQSLKKKPTPKSAKRSSARRQWVPLDPTSSRLIWVRSSAENEVKSAPRSNPKRKTIKPARHWVPMDPSSTRLVWIRRVESAARKESRYKAASSTRKWIPLDPTNSNFIWVRRQVVPIATVA
ncbi:hypothetical protein P3T76_001595 [Phytophthora citrophthora]|uniref:PH domain-containing protein n=1 Tax=Phytophthora citrophthora TaxID=4793 RepID=A0AAD9LRW0_9STRA|nr:hypothetical protein P3T76_001595 [Phytophthora citrophthora]